MNKKQKYSAGLIAALIVVLAIAGIAIAATQSPILARIFGNNEPSETASQLLKSGQYFTEVDGLRLTVDETLQDQNMVAVTYTLTSTLNEPVLLEGVDISMATGNRGSGSSSLSLHLLDGELDGVHYGNSITSTEVFHIDDALSYSQPATIRLEAQTYRPMRPFVTAPYPGTDFYPDSHALYFTGGYTNPWHYEEAVALSEASHKRLLDGEEYSPGDAMCDLGMMKPVAKAYLQFTLTPDIYEQSRGTWVLGAKEFEFVDYTMKIDELNFTATNTQFTCWIYPKEPPKDFDPDRDEKHPLERMYALLDEDGNDLQALASGQGDSYAYPVIFEGGDAYFACELFFGPIKDVPKSVTILPIDNFAPTNEEGSAQYDLERREHFAWDEAVTVEVSPRSRDAKS